MSLYTPSERFHAVASSLYVGLGVAFLVLGYATRSNTYKYWMVSEVTTLGAEDPFAWGTSTNHDFINKIVEECVANTLQNTETLQCSLTSLCQEQIVHNALHEVNDADFNTTIISIVVLCILGSAGHCIQNLLGFTSNLSPGDTIGHLRLVAFFNCYHDTVKSIFFFRIISYMLLFRSKQHLVVFPLTAFVLAVGIQGTQQLICINCIYWYAKLEGANRACSWCLKFVVVLQFCVLWLTGFAWSLVAFTFIKRVDVLEARSDVNTENFGIAVIVRLVITGIVFSWLSLLFIVSVVATTIFKPKCSCATAFPTNNNNNDSEFLRIVYKGTSLLQLMMNVSITLVFSYFYLSVYKCELFIKCTAVVAGVFSFVTFILAWVYM
jgi:hypothetical protein